MKKISFVLLFSMLSIITFLVSCDDDHSSEPQKKESQENPNEQQTETVNNDKESETFDMSNPAFMMGTNLGVLFKTYYKVGDYSKMLTYTSRSTIEKYGAEKLRNIYRNLELGYDMKLTNMTTEGKEKILHYEIVINATRQIKRLHVVIENDTARVVPQHLERGEIFE